MAGNTRETHEIVSRYFALVKAFFGNGPFPLKYAMGLMGQEIGARLTPLWEPDDATKELLRTELEKHRMLTG